MKRAAISIICLLLLTAPLAAELDRTKLREAIAQAATWTTGADSKHLKYVREAAVQAAKNPEEARQVEEMLIAALKTEGTKQAKSFFCRHLVIVGSKACAPALGALLDDKDLSHMARFALERIPCPECGDALIKGLAGADDPLKAGIIASLGRRRETRAAAEIAKYTGSENIHLASAAFAALGRIGSDEAVRVIAKARPDADARIRSTADNAYLDAARILAENGKTSRAIAIYEQLYKPSDRAMTRIGALAGLAACNPDKAVVLAIEALGDKDARVRSAAIPMLRATRGKAATRAIAAELSKRPPAMQVMLIKVLVDRGDPGALADIIKLTSSGDAAVKTAAIGAMSALGDATAVPMLIELPVNATGEDQKAARYSLDVMQAEGVNEAIAKQLSSSNAKIRLEAARSLGARKACDCVEAVIKAVDDNDPEVSKAAMKSLRALAGPEQVPALVAFILKIENADVRREAEKALLTAASRIPPDKQPAKALLAAMPNAKGPAKVSLITVMGSLADKTSLNAIVAATRDGDKDVKLAAVRALSAWPSFEPAASLKKISQDSSMPENIRILALRGHISQIALHPDATEDQLLAMYGEAMKIAARTEEKKSVLYEVSEMRYEGAIEMAKKYLDDPALKSTAAEAIKKIEKALKAPALVTASHNPGKAKNAVDNNPGTRWDTGASMRGGEWFLLDLGRRKTVRKIVLDTKGSAGDYPRGYEVYVSNTAMAKGKKVASGAGTGPVTEIKINPPAAGRFIKIVQTGKTGGLFWSIHELKVE